MSLSSARRHLVLRGALLVIAGLSGAAAGFLPWIDLPAAGEFGLREVRWWMPWLGLALALGAAGAGIANWRRMSGVLAAGCVLLWVGAAGECARVLHSLGPMIGPSASLPRLWASAEWRVGAALALGAVLAWAAAAAIGYRRGDSLGEGLAAPPLSQSK